MMKKTNAARLLDARGVAYELAEYEVDESDLSAVTLAKKIGQNIEQIFKTLVLRGDKSGVFVVVIPGNAEVDLKKAARLSGNKSAAMVQQKELLGLTGYIRGGCSPLGMKKPYPVFIDESCLLYDTIFISAGQRGLQLKIDPEDLISVIDPVVGDVTE
jgi:Cys-tRNA(Pro)/Cys-tRNA(Cys) deacylase